jgi:replicative DNA helicase
VLNPIEHYLLHGGTPIEVVYWSMERRQQFNLLKWLSRRIFLDEGMIIPMERLMGWCKSEDRIKPSERSLIDRYRDYMEAILSCIHIEDDNMNHNPTGMRNYMKTFFATRGRIEVISEHKKVYIPNDPTKIILMIKDHLGKIKREKNLNLKKEIIDKVSDDDGYFRDFYQSSSVQISQFNRDISNPMRIKSGDVEPMLEDFKDSGCTQEDADVVISLFDPSRYKVPDPSGYNLDKLNKDQGKMKYRSIKILKNSYGTDNMRIGMAFQGDLGLFAEMPKRADITDTDYERITDNTYFLPRH